MMTVRFRVQQGKRPDPSEGISETLFLPLTLLQPRGGKKKNLQLQLQATLSPRQDPTQEARRPGLGGVSSAMDLSQNIANRCT
jgi:hypothetical protein